MIDLFKLGAALELARGPVEDVLSQFEPLPAEAALLARLVGYSIPGESSSGVTPAHAWALVWRALRVATGEPVWSSFLLKRLSELSRDWGGIECLYGSLMPHLAEADPENSAVQHFVRELGRTLRASGLVLATAPAASPYRPLQSLALLYAPGAERFDPGVYDQMLDGAIGSAFEEEVRLGLGL